MAVQDAGSLNLHQERNPPMVYLVTYDLKQPGQDYSGVHEAIKSCGAWWHFLESTWLVDTHLTADQISTKVN